MTLSSPNDGKVKHQPHSPRLCRYPRGRNRSHQWKRKRYQHKVHLLRNTFRYASRKYWDQIAEDIRAVYTEAAAKERFVGFTAK